MLQDIGYKQSNHEPCVYFKTNKNRIVIVALYVDDFFIFLDDTGEKLRLKIELMKRFQIKDLGEIRQCLGLSVERNKQTGEIFVHQKRYIEEILKRFNMEDSKPVATPVDLGMKGVEDTSDVVTHVPYQNVIESLI